MKHFLIPLAILLTCLPAQAGIFNLDDDTLDIIPAQPEKPVKPIKGGSASADHGPIIDQESPKPLQDARPAPVPASSDPPPSSRSAKADPPSTPSANLS